MLHRRSLLLVGLALLCVVVAIGPTWGSGGEAKAIIVPNDVAPPELDAQVQFVANPSSNGRVCDAVMLECRVPNAALGGGFMVFGGAQFFRKVDNEWVREDGAGENAYVLPVQCDGYQMAGCMWLTEDTPNTQAVEWKVEYYIYDQMGPDYYGAKTATWTPYNAVVTGTEPPLVIHHRGDQTHTISWNIDHLRDLGQGINPNFTVNVTIYNLSGGVVATLPAKTNVSVGNDQTTWTPVFDPELQPDTDAIFTYRITVSDGGGFPCSASWPSEGIGFNTPLNFSGLTFKQSQLQLTGRVPYHLTRTPNQTKIYIYGPDLGSPTVTQAPAVQEPPDGGATVNHDVPYNKLGNYTVVIVPYDDGNNRSGNAQPGLPQGGISPCIASSFCFNTMLTGIPQLNEIMFTAKIEQEHGPVYTPEGIRYVPPGYQCTLCQNGSTLGIYRRLSNQDPDGNDWTTRDAMIFFAGHAAPGVLCTSMFPQGWNCLLAGAGVNDPLLAHYYIDNLPDGCLNKCQLVLLVGCNTAVNDEHGSNLLTYFIAKGAGCAIGSLRTIQPDEAQRFSDAFWQYAMGAGYSASAARLAAEDESNTHFSWAQMGSTTGLRPAAYE